MLYLRRTSFLRLVVLPLMLVAFLSACQKWVELEPPFADAIERDQPDRVRLTIDGERVIISKPVVVNDSIVEWLGIEPFSDVRVLSRFALEDIQSVEELKDNTVWIGGLGYP